MTKKDLKFEIEHLKIDMKNMRRVVERLKDRNEMLERVVTFSKDGKITCGLVNEPGGIVLYIYKDRCELLSVRLRELEYELLNYESKDIICISGTNNLACFTINDFPNKDGCFNIYQFIIDLNRGTYVYSERKGKVTTVIKKADEPKHAKRRKK